VVVDITLFLMSDENNLAWVLEGRVGLPGCSSLVIRALGFGVGDVEEEGKRSFGTKAALGE